MFAQATVLNYTRFDVLEDWGKFAAHPTDKHLWGMLLKADFGATDRAEAAALVFPKQILL